MHKRAFPPHVAPLSVPTSPLPSPPSSDDRAGKLACHIGFELN